MARFGGLAVPCDDHTPFKQWNSYIHVLDRFIPKWRGFKRAKCCPHV